MLDVSFNLFTLIALFLEQWNYHFSWEQDVFSCAKTNFGFLPSVHVNFELILFILHGWVN